MENLRNALGMISMNLLTFRYPNNIIIGDACEHGLGDFNTSDQAWQWTTQKYLRVRSHINLLELITHVMQIYFDILYNRIKS